LTALKQKKRDREKFQLCLWRPFYKTQTAEVRDRISQACTQLCSIWHLCTQFGVTSLRWCGYRLSL